MSSSGDPADADRAEIEPIGVHFGNRGLVCERAKNIGKSEIVPSGMRVTGEKDAPESCAHRESLPSTKAIDAALLAPTAIEPDDPPFSQWCRLQDSNL